MCDKNNTDNINNISDQQVDELLELIEKTMAKGSGHVNIDVNESNDIKVDTFKSSDCGTGNMACCVPNERCEDDDEF